MKSHAVDTWFCPMKEEGIGCGWFHSEDGRLGGWVLTHPFLPRGLGLPPCHLPQVMVICIHLVQDFLKWNKIGEDTNGFCDSSASVSPTVS